MPLAGSVNQLITNVESVCTQVGQSIVKQSSSNPWPWMVPTVNGWDGKLFDIEKMSNAFDRASLNSQAFSNYTSGGTVGQAISSNLQIQYVGMMERSFRMRHKTPVRCMIQAGGKRYAHGLASGIHGVAKQFLGGAE